METRNMERHESRRRFSGFDKKFLLLGVFLAVVAILDVVHASPSLVDQTQLDGQSIPSHNSPVLPPIVGGKKGKPGQVKTKKRKLYGRFLHITDLHPDNYYVPHASTANACHSRLPEPEDPDEESKILKKPKGPEDGGEDDFDTAGDYGAPASNCDSPHTLVNATFDWIKNNLMNSEDDSMGIDFVIWTGDSARHDNDLQRPRTEREILSLNELMVEKMYETFGNKDGMDDEDPTNDFLIPVVPTLGNNDILPHNIFFPGPSALTREYLDLWKSFVPEDQFHIFDRGAYFWKDVVPGNKNGESDQLEHGGLAVISLNTLYFFNSNSAVDGCDLPSEPGYQQMEWLRVQLELMRQTNMKAILIGHVPPARVREVGWREGGRDDWEAGWGKRSWDETCWRKYVLWSQQYRDVIAGSIYGHMNLDHFIVMDTKELERKHNPRKDQDAKSVVYTGSDHEPTVRINSAEDYLISLREGFARLPQPGPPRGKKGKNAPKGIDWKSKYIEDIGGEHGERFIVNVVGPSVVPNYFPTLRVVEYNITGISPPLDDDDNVETQEEAQVTQTKNQIEDELRKRNADPSKKKKEPKKPKRPQAPTPKPPSPTAPPGPAYSNQPFTLLGYTQFYANLTRINSGRNKGRLETESVDNEFRYEVEYNTLTDHKYGLKDMTVRSYLDLAHKLVDARRPVHKKKGKKGKKKLAQEEGEDIEDEELDFDEFEENDDAVDVLERKGREHKGHRHRKGNKNRDKIFREFLNRAFVQTISPTDLDAILGIDSHVIDPIDDGDSDDHRKPLAEGVKVSFMGTGRSRPLEFMQGVCREGEMTVEDQLEVLHGMEKDIRIAWRQVMDEEEHE